MTETFETKLVEAESKLKSIAEDGGSDDEDGGLAETMKDSAGDAADAAAEKVDDVTDGGRDGEGLTRDLRDVLEVLDQAEDILEAIDFAELPEAVDREQVLEAIELGDVPDALRDSEDEEVVRLRQLLRAISIRKLLGDVDVTELWSSKRDAEDAIDDLTDDEDDEGMIGQAATAMTEDDDDDGVIDEATDRVGDDDDELIETDADDVMEMGARAAKSDFDVGDGDLSAYEEIIQQQAIEGVDEFRDGLLRAHGKFERVIEENRERTRNIDRQPSSRNPTAVSTIETPRSDVASVANHSTVPQKVRHSNAPGRKRIYGDRFRRERERRGYDR
ncbi:hypothetical protein [Halovivax sp.]|uniref:hypothetical protein n=1 Tax=Halovivax sp. TaxID=1935978 RepID=UPI0025C4C644|nr:hypothetical protein [Halovivax sp.]